MTKNNQQEIISRSINRILKSNILVDKNDINLHKITHSDVNLIDFI